MDKKVRGYIYSFFPAEIDVRTGEVELLEKNWQWFFFRWLFWLTNFFGGIFVESPVFRIKLKREDLVGLTQEELIDLKVYEE